MKIKYILIIGTILLFSLVSADVISINSGGGEGLILNPNTFLEGFFSKANILPVASNFVLFSSSGLNTTNENLSISYSSTDANGDVITNITDWRLGGSSIVVLNMPFDKNVIELTSGAVRDYSSYGNNGTLGFGVLANSPTWNSSCKVGGCYQFDGVNDYMDLGDYDEVNALKFDAGNWSVFSWVKVNKQNTSSTIFGLRTGSDQDFRIGIDVNNKAYVTWVSYPSQPTYSTTTGLISLNDSNWHQVGAKRGGNTISLYVDGILVGTDTNVGNYDLTGSGWFSRWSVGAYREGCCTTWGAGYWKSFFNGSIEEVQVFNRALSPEQINVMYQEGLAGHHVEKFVSQETSKGDVWQVALTPNDRIADGATILSNILTIIDSTPEDPTSVKLISVDGSNESDANLNCSGFVQDKDNLLLTAYFNWLKDDVSILNQTFSNQNNGTTVSSVLGSGNLTLGDVWKCSIRSYDGVDYSEWIDSNELTIIDITAPNITIISPLSFSEYNYTSLNVSFNVSVSDNEDGSACLYNLDTGGNVSMIAINSTYYWSGPTLGPGNHSVIFYCNDTSNNWNSSSVDFEILNEAAISISISANLSLGVEWYLASLPVNDQHAIGNNETGITLYYINISAINTNVDLYIRATGDLLNEGEDVLGLGNETYRYNITDATVSNGTNITMTTNYSLIGSGLVDGNVVYLKFFLDAPVSQAAGSYTNGLDIKAVRGGQSP